MTRYLTPESKAEILAEWAEQRSPGVVAGVSDGGRGVPDAEMIPWCAELNSIDGICTLQSCAGHVEPDNTRSSGHLWLWLDECLAKRFRGEVVTLVQSSSLLDRVATVYLSSGIEIVEIAFAGDELGRLDESMCLICSFFRSLQYDEPIEVSA